MGSVGITFLHCPFCGGQAVMKEMKIHAGGFRYHIDCKDCPCCMYDFTSKEKALETWNKRTFHAPEITTDIVFDKTKFDEEIKRIGAVLNNIGKPYKELYEEKEEGDITWEA